MFLLHTISCWKGNPYSKEDHSNERRGGEFIAKCKAQDLSLTFEMTILSFRARPIGRRGIPRCLPGRAFYKRYFAFPMYDILPIMDWDSSHTFGMTFALKKVSSGLLPLGCSFYGTTLQRGFFTTLTLRSEWHLLWKWDSSGLHPSEWYEKTAPYRHIADTGLPLWNT